VPFEKELLSLQPGEQTIIIIKGRGFLVRPADDDDYETVSRGYECLD